MFKKKQRTIDTEVVKLAGLMSELKVVSDARLRFFHVFVIVIFVAGFTGLVTWLLAADYFQSIYSYVYTMQCMPLR